MKLSLSIGVLTLALGIVSQNASASLPIGPPSYPDGCPGTYCMRIIY